MSFETVGEFECLAVSGRNIGHRRHSAKCPRGISRRNLESLKRFSRMAGEFFERLDGVSYRALPFPRARVTFFLTAAGPIRVLPVGFRLTTLVPRGKRFNINPLQ